MRTSEFVACSIAFHIALIVASLLLPPPFPAPRDTDSGVTYVELQKETAEGGDTSSVESTDDYLPMQSEVRPKSSGRSRGSDNTRDRAGSGSHHPPAGASSRPAPSSLENPSGAAPPPAKFSPEQHKPVEASARPAPQPSQPPQIALTAPDRPGIALKAGRGRISFNYQRGLPVPSMVKVGITSGPDESWTARADSGWIIVTPSSGRGDGTLKVGVDVSRLQLGFYEGNVKITPQGQGVNGDEVDVTLMVLPKSTGASELPHSSWDEYMNGECKVCHLPEQIMAAKDMLEPRFCNLCHSAAGMAKSKVPGKGGHPLMVDAGANGTRMPTRGTIVSGPKSDRMDSHLLGGKKVVCVTCHNVMGKPGEHSRSWELAETRDRTTYTLPQGGWEGSGYIVPRVYITRSFLPMPKYLKEAHGYLADPGDYTYDESDGTITFKRSLDRDDCVYVTLTNPYLRVTTQDNALCYDCHYENTHQGLNCLVCHRAHGTRNIMGIGETVRTPDGARRVVFTAHKGAGSFAAGAGSGICEVCHPLRKHKDGKDYTGTDCTRCHTHKDGFGA